MVSTYSPTHCGIGAYGEQSVTQLRAQGHIVDIVSPDEQGNVDFAWDLRGGSKLLRLFDLLPYYDRVVIQYHWAFFYDNPFVKELRWDTLQTTLCFVWLFLRSRKIEVVAHEIPYLPGKQGWLYKWKWKFAPRVIFHTRKERERFEKHYHLRLSDSRVEYRQHDEVYQKFVEHTQASARRQLKLTTERTLFLCIGFIQRHKGFHRAIQAFAQANCLMPNFLSSVPCGSRTPKTKSTGTSCELSLQGIATSSSLNRSSAMKTSIAGSAPPTASFFPTLRFGLPRFWVALSCWTVPLSSLPSAGCPIRRANGIGSSIRMRIWFPPFRPLPRS